MKFKSSLPLELLTPGFPFEDGDRVEDCYGLTGTVTIGVNGRRRIVRDRFARRIVAARRK